MIGLHWIAHDRLGPSGKVPHDATTRAEAPASAEAVAEAQRRHDERIHRIETTLAGEIVEPGWSGQTSQAIHNAFAQDVYGGARLVAVECRSTLCRVDVLHESSARMQEFTALFPSTVTERLPQMTMQQVPNDDGTVTTVLYIARQGYEIPGCSADSMGIRGKLRFGNSASVSGLESRQGRREQRTHHRFLPSVWAQAD